MIAVVERTGSESSPEPSQEALDAIESAKRARLSSEAALPAAERIRDRVREVLAANHFAELMEATLREAARRRRAA